MNSYPDNSPPDSPEPDPITPSSDQFPSALDANPPEMQIPELPQPGVSFQPPDPAWNGWDVVRLAILVVVALFVSILGAVFITHRVLYPAASLQQVTLMPLVSIFGQAFGYLVVLGYMYVLVTRERHRPDFLKAIHWNWPPVAGIYLLVGVVLSVLLQLLANHLPVPKTLPIDKFFQTPMEAWVVTICGISLFPLMEELFFRGFLYPVLKKRLGLMAGVILTAFAFAILHGAQLTFAWGPVLVIFLVGLTLTLVREWRNSVAAGLLVHIAYNGFISAAMFVSTGGFRHLEKLSNQ